MRVFVVAGIIGLLSFCSSPAHAQRSAHDAVAQFLSAWKKSDYKGMARVSQRSEKETVSDIKIDFGDKKLLSYQIMKQEVVSSEMVTTTVRIKYAVRGRKPETHIITPNAIRQRDAYNSNRTISWGVNSISAMNER